MTVINQDAQTVVKIYETSTGKELPRPEAPEGDISGVDIAPSERRMAFYVNGDRSLANLYVYEFATARASRLTNSLNPQIDSADLVEAQIVRYKSFDDLAIQAYATLGLHAVVGVTKSKEDPYCRSDYADNASNDSISDRMSQSRQTATDAPENRVEVFEVRGRPKGGKWPA